MAMYPKFTNYFRQKEYVKYIKDNISSIDIGMIKLQNKRKELIEKLKIEEEYFETLSEYDE